MALDEAAVDADHEASGRHVLVTECRPLVGGHAMKLGHLAWMRVTGHRFHERSGQLWTFTVNIEPSNECPAMHLEAVLLPGDALNAGRQRSLAVPQLQALQRGLSDARQILGYRI